MNRRKALGLALILTLFLPVGGYAFFGCDIPCLLRKYGMTRVDKHFDEAHQLWSYIKIFTTDLKTYGIESAMMGALGVDLSLPEVTRPSPEEVGKKYRNLSVQSGKDQTMNAFLKHGASSLEGSRPATGFELYGQIQEESEPMEVPDSILPRSVTRSLLEVMHSTPDERASRRMTREYADLASFEETAGVVGEALSAIDEIKKAMESEFSREVAVTGSSGKAYPAWASNASAIAQQRAVRGAILGYIAKLHVQKVKLLGHLNAQASAQYERDLVSVMRKDKALIDAYRNAIEW